VVTHLALCCASPAIQETCCIGTLTCKRLILTTCSLIAASLAVSTPAHAKSVHLAWKPIPHALRYEIRIERGGKVIVKKLLDHESWAGELPFGVYAYQIRAWDKIKRAGEWSAPSALVVMAGAPQALPADEKEKVFFTPKTQVILRWKAVPTAKRYLVEVKREGEKIHSETVTATELSLDSLKAGHYTWQVAAVFEADGRGPSSIQGRHWDSALSETIEFTLKHEALPAPTQKAPLGRFRPPTDGKLQLSWAKVDGAEGYEVSLKKIPEAGRGPAAEEAVYSKYVTQADHLEVQVTGDGHYVWQVRAIASISERKDPDSLGTQSVARFALDRNAIYDPHTGFIALGTFFAPYTYQVKNPQTGGNTLATSSVATSIGISGEYWTQRQWGFGASFNDRFFALGGQNFTDPELQLVEKYRLVLDSGAFPWALYPVAGVELRQYTDITPSTTGIGLSGSDSFMTAGPLIGMELRKQLTEKFTLGGKVLYYVPVLGGSSSANLSAGLQAYYWFADRWAVGAGLFVENRSIDHTTASGDEEIQMNGSYFFASLIWSF
jgi:hypothetical protein